MASLKSVLKCWRDFDLPTLQKELDNTANEVALRQDGAEASRKKLIGLTKEFRKDWDEETRKRIAPLIKAFQGEVDSLTKRSKAAEASFLTLYKRVLEVPDPSPYLEQTQKYQMQLMKAQDLELENKSLKETLSEYNKEFADVKNQEVTINKLKLEIKEYQDFSDQRVKEQLQVQARELQIKFEEREKKLQQVQFDAASKLGEAEEKIRSLQASLEDASSELFAFKSKAEEEVAAKVAEVEMIENDLDIATQRALAAERFAESLQEDLNNALSAQTETEHKAYVEDSFVTTGDLEQQLRDRESELNKMMEEVHFQQNALTKMRENSRQEIASLEAQLKDALDSLDVLQSTVNAQHDYDDIKRELNILKMVEFGSTVEDTGAGKKSVEQLLLEKNKQLQAESANLHVSNHELRIKCSELERKESENVRKIKEHEELILQLERDLMNVHSVTPGPRGEGEGESNPSEVNIVGKAVLEVYQESEPKEEESGSMLSIVANQRERFRNRVLELEAQGRHNQQQILLLRNEVDSLRTDNIKLYEKIKFLQSYPSQGANFEDDSVKRYSAPYEQKIDPFAAFSKRERQQRYLNLSAAEKVTLNLGRFVLSNKIARTIVFFYTIFLHLLVFLVLYKLANTETCRRDFAVDCAKKFAEHMFQYHGPSDNAPLHNHKSNT